MADHEDDLERASSNTTLPAHPEHEKTSLGRTRSQNGYGVDNDAAATETPPEHHAKEVDPFEVAWEGGDSDPWSPRSFNKARKWAITLILCTGSLTVTMTSSIYTATYVQMEEEFHNSRIISVLGLSTFVLGISLGPMLMGPLSEFYGRRPIYVASFAMFVIWLIPSAVAKNITTMLIARFFDGFAGSAFLAVSGGTVGDMFTRNELQAPMAFFTAAPFIGPSSGPLIGGFICYYTYWRWTYYVLIIFSFGMFLCIVIFVPETFHPVVLRNKARQLRKDTGDERWKAPMEKVEKSVVRAIATSLTRPFLLLIFEPMCLNLCVLSALLLGILYLFFGAFPLVFQTNYGFNLWQTGLSFMGIGVGMVIGVLLDPLWARLRMSLVKQLEEQTGVAGASEPELRLPSAIFGAVLAPVGVFIFAWSCFPWVHWIVPMIGSVVFGIGVLFVFSGVFTFLVDAYPTYAASALSANAFVRCLFAAAFPLFGNQMYEKLGYHWATSLLGFLLVAMMPFPYLFFRIGKRLRSKSRFAKS